MSILLKSVVISSVFGGLGPALYFISKKINATEQLYNSIAMLWPTWMLGAFEEQWGWMTIYICIVSNMFIFILIGFLMALSSSKSWIIFLSIVLLVAIIWFSKMMTNMDILSLAFLLVVLGTMFFAIQKWSGLAEV